MIYTIKHRDKTGTTEKLSICIPISLHRSSRDIICPGVGTKVVPICLAQVADILTVAKKLSRLCRGKNDSKTLIISALTSFRTKIIGTFRKRVALLRRLNLEIR
jgi:hypothetical protein